MVKSSRNSSVAKIRCKSHSDMADSSALAFATTSSWYASVCSFGRGCTSKTFQHRVFSARDGPLYDTVCHKARVDKRRVLDTIVVELTLARWEFREGLVASSRERV